MSRRGFGRGELGGRGLGRHGRGEIGGVTVVVVAAVGVAFVLIVGGLALSSAVVATHRARSAADLGALAASQALQAGADPRAACTAGASITARNGARPQGCFVAGDGSVTVRARVTAGFSLPGLVAGTTTATARAGPSP